MLPKGYNRHLIGGKRRHKGINNIPIECINNLSKRLLFEVKQLEKYRKRVGNQK